MTSVEEGINLAVLSGVFLASRKRAGIYHIDLSLFHITDGGETAGWGCAADGCRCFVWVVRAAFFHGCGGFDPEAQQADLSARFPTICHLQRAERGSAALCLPDRRVESPAQKPDDGLSRDEPHQTSWDPTFSQFSWEAES